MNNYSTTVLTMARHFEVPAEKVYHAWLNPEMMKKWLFTLERTNKIIRNNPIVGGDWEIVDHRGGVDYRAIGKYVELDVPHKLVFTFKMPQFSEWEDTIAVELTETSQGCEMIFTHNINVPHEPSWTEADIEKAKAEAYDGTEHGWNLMFMGLKELVETGKVSYTG
ncbi:SRPBCC domain-containing protein [Paenibacillus sp. SC116]|uniref:SRPBCC family protein n=1 Tax=Paenibacillus sp. SC116 TaxID=2968986 RepID=UPI00215A7F0D|nr:SRPBCC domain-containing protein [Paenibacillus sp. SC116]MCR8844331.1 SRPBCC domain-containing protein [Paenibacillus sp. SC116]